MVENQDQPQTLADYLAGIALRPDVAALQVYGMIEKLRERLIEMTLLNLAIFRARPDRIDEYLVTCGQLHALFSALKALCQGRKPEEIDFVSLPPVVPDKSDFVAPTPGAKSKADYPGVKFLLSPEESARSSAEVLDDGSRLAHMVIPVILRAKLLTLGQLIERWQYKDHRLLSLPGIGPAAIAKVIRPRVAKALGVSEAAALGSILIKGSKEVTAKPAKQSRPVTRLANMDEPWVSYGMTQEQWRTPLKGLLTESSFEAKKLKRLIGRRKLTVGEVLGPTKGKMVRIKKQFFPKNFGPETQKYLKALLAALKVPPTMLVMTMVPSAPAPTTGGEGQ